MRDAMKQLGGDPSLINPLQPVELVIDHSVQVDEFGTSNALEMNALLEFQRNKERYSFLRWGQTGFRNLAIVPPDTGIVHQVNLEYLARVVFVRECPGKRVAYPDTLVGTDSHTTMVNGLGVLGWGVGGIEAEAAMLGQPVSMLIPLVVGVKLTGTIARRRDCHRSCSDHHRDAAQAWRSRQIRRVLRAGIARSPSRRSRHHRQHVSRVRRHLRNLPHRQRDSEISAAHRTHRRTDRSRRVLRREQGMFHDDKTPEAEYSELLSLDLATVEPSLAGPKRPQDRVVLSQAGESFCDALPGLMKPKAATKAGAIPAVAPSTKDRWEQEGGQSRCRRRRGSRLFASMFLSPSRILCKHGSVVIAAITSCTNTSNPSVLIGAGLLAKKAVEKGLTVPALGQDFAGSGFESRHRLPSRRPGSCPISRS